MPDGKCDQGVQSEIWLETTTISTPSTMFLVISYPVFQPLDIKIFVKILLFMFDLNRKRNRFGDDETK